MRLAHSRVVRVHRRDVGVPGGEVAAATWVQWDLDVGPPIDLARPRGAMGAAAVVGGGVVHHQLNALGCVVGVAGVVVGPEAFGASDRFGPGLDHAQAGAEILDHGVGGATLSQALSHGCGRGLGEALTVLAEVALGLAGGGDRGLEGDGNVDARAEFDLTGELVSHGQAVAAGCSNQVTQDAVVGIHLVGVERRHQLAELLKQGQVALSWIAVARPHVDPSAAHQAVEAGVEDAVQHGDGAGLGGLEEAVVALYDIHRDLTSRYD